MTVALSLAFMSFGFTEILVVGTVALLVFGGQLPDVMRNLGRAYGRFRHGLSELSRPVREELRQVRDMPSMTQDKPAPGPEYDIEPETAPSETAPPETASSDSDADLFDADDEPPPV